MIVVIGGGTMGGGIAVSFVLAGESVRIVEGSDELVQAADGRVRASLVRAAERRGRSDEIEALQKLLHFDTEHRPGGVELVIEAVPEDTALKQKIFSSIEGIYDGSTIFGSNTSSLSITEIASVLERPKRFVGMHFFNPVPASNLVEIVVGAETSEATTNRVVELAVLLDKTPIVVQDSPGFASSRLGLTLGLEAIRMVESGVASAEDIDAAMTLGYKHPIGPLKLTDLVGVDVRLAIAEHLAETLGERFEPPQLMRDMVAEGKLGEKSGEGFYVW
ncbi:MAG: 3-hydroxybutyryl-CoA dehydrogenase [Verrucomicrobiales bacterium]